MYTVRRWAVRHARSLEWLYDRAFEPVLVALHPLWRRIGYQRLEKPFVQIERAVKGFLFDCQMCGHCVLSATGMSCPMNCPKSMRNGPCGGVRPNGRCEVKPQMYCVWVDAWDGSRRMRAGGKILLVQPPPPFRARGSSSWLRVVRQKTQAKPFTAENDE